MEAPGSRGVPWLMVAVGGVLLVLLLIAAAVAGVGLPQLGPQPTPAPVAPSGNAAPSAPEAGEPAEVNASSFGWAACA